MALRVKLRKNKKKTEIMNEIWIFTVIYAIKQKKNVSLMLQTCSTGFLRYRIVFLNKIKLQY